MPSNSKWFRFAHGIEQTNKHSQTQVVFRDYMLKNYGMTPAQYSRTHAPSHCPICQEPMNHDKRGVHLDHDHASLEVRGILCRECNIMLGKARDNPFILISAAMYLNKTAPK